jgi:hypothetical protein
MARREFMARMFAREVGDRREQLLIGQQLCDQISRTVAARPAGNGDCLQNIRSTNFDIVKRATCHTASWHACCNPCFRFVQ